MRLYLSSYRLGKHPEELTKLLGGKTRAAIIPNAGDAYPPGSHRERLGRETAALKDLGLEPTVLDLRGYFSRPEDLKFALESVDLLWVLGGNAFVLRRAFRASGLDDLLPRLLAADRLVYAGYSAGIDQLVPHLHGAELVDDPHAVPADYPDKIIWDGLNVLPYSVAPHYKSDHPEAAAIGKSVDYMIEHHIPFIALRDGQAIVHHGSHEKVVG